MKSKDRKRPSGVGIIGIGSYVPEDTLTNFDLEKIVDTNDRWIRERTGISTRHKADARTATSDLAAKAAQMALEDAGLESKDIDVIIVGTATPDMFLTCSAKTLKDGKTQGAGSIRPGCTR